MILNMAEINVIHELDIVRKLAELTHIPSERSIFRVHDQLRNENKNAYEPQVVAIGPYHHGKGNLQPMEEHKLCYLQQLHNRRNEGTVEGYIEALREFEPEAPEFYAEPISLDSNAFVEMMLLDSCFVVEFLFKFLKFELREPNDPMVEVDIEPNDPMVEVDIEPNDRMVQVDIEPNDPMVEVDIEPNDPVVQVDIVPNDRMVQVDIEPNDPIFQFEHIRRGIFRDLVLFENQLPLFIVEMVFNMTNNSPDSLDDFLRPFTRYFYWITPRQSFSVTTANMKHLLGLLHHRCCYQFHSNISQTSELKYNPRKSATELHEAGIKFKKIETGLDLPEVTRLSFVSEEERKKKMIQKNNRERSLFDIRFVNGTMEIPTLLVQDSTESVLRNLIAYEQYLPDSWHHFTAYHNFMDCLVNTSKDVEILTHHGIIHNFLGENEVVATTLNKLGNNTIASDIGYEEVYNKLNEHCRKKWNVWLAILRRDYFNNPWALISFLAAAALLLLSLLQTTFTIHPVGKSN